MRGLALHLLLAASVALALDRPSDVTALMAHSKAFQRCYARALRNDPSLKGKVVLHLDVAPSGRVTEAKVTQSTMPDWSLHRCLESEAARVRFPADDGPRSLDVPLYFVADD